jgi:hypothetical protein
MNSKYNKYIHMKGRNCVTWIVTEGIGIGCNNKEGREKQNQKLEKG